MMPVPRWIWPTLEVAASIVLVAGVIGHAWAAVAAMAIVVVAMEIQRRI